MNVHVCRPVYVRMCMFVYAQDCMHVRMDVCFVTGKENNEHKRRGIGVRQRYCAIDVRLFSAGVRIEEEEEHKKKEDEG